MSKLKIKNIYVDIFLCVSMFLATFQSTAQTKATIASDVEITKNYYDSMVNKSPLPLAQLNLFANQMPKGGDIHHHYSGALYAETYLDWASESGLCINRHTYKINFVKDAYKTEADCLTVAALRADDVLYRQLLVRWSDKDFSNHFHDATPPDEHFFSTFQYFIQIAQDHSAAGLQLIKTRAINQNVQYIETIFALAPAEPGNSLVTKLDTLAPELKTTELHAIFDIQNALLENNSEVQRRIEMFAADIDAATMGLDDDTFILRTQSYVLRDASPASVFASMYSGFKAAQHTKKLVGLNIVGPENSPRALRDYRLHMQMFNYFKSKYPAVRLSLHAGELSMGMVPPEELRFHISEAVNIAGANRIGHGVDVMYEKDADHLLRKLSDNGIAIEINLTSNEFIVAVSGMHHPITLYMQRGVPVVISTDDEGVSRSSMSNEYLLFMSRYQPSYSTLKTTVYNSLKYSFLNDAEKVTQKKILDSRFASFERDIAQSLKFNASFTKQ